MSICVFRVFLELQVYQISLRIQVDHLWNTYFIFIKNGKNELLNDNVLYHLPSGLHSEGNWHNCLMGLVYTALWRKTSEQKFKNAFELLATSLFNLNFDLKYFAMNQKTYTTYWMHHSPVEGILTK